MSIYHCDKRYGIVMLIFPFPTLSRVVLSSAAKIIPFYSFFLESWYVKWSLLIECRINQNWWIGFLSRWKWETIMLNGIIANTQRDHGFYVWINANSNKKKDVEQHCLCAYRPINQQPKCFDSVYIKSRANNLHGNREEKNRIILL